MSAFSTLKYMKEVQISRKRKLVWFGKKYIFNIRDYSIILDFTRKNFLVTITFNIKNEMNTKNHKGKRRPCI